METQERKHHFFSPSSLKRRELCPASYVEEGAVDRSLLPPSPYAERGTRIHDIAEAIVGNILNTENYVSHTDDCESDEERLAWKIGDFVASERGRWGVDGEWFYKTEGKVEYNEFLETLYYGYFDLMVHNKKDNKAYIYDWKTGFRAVEEAADNPQGAAYALAVMQEYRVNAVEVIFFNPAIGQISRHTFEGMDGIAAYIHRVIDACKSPNPAHNVGEEQCRYCAAAQLGTCGAYLAHHNALDNAAHETAYLPIPKLDDESLSELYRRCRAVAKLSEAVESELKGRVEKNGACGDWKIKCQSGGREVTDVAHTWLVAREVMSDSDIIDCATVSIAKLEKAFGKAGKASGKFKTEKEAKAYFAAETAEFVADKPARKCLYEVPRNEED